VLAADHNPPLVAKNRAAIGRKSLLDWGPAEAGE
jgi:hypothetical protein